MTKQGRKAMSAVLVLALASSGCAMQYKKEEAAAASTPVNCATAQGDIRVLENEKAHVASQVAMGVTAIYPAGLVVGLLTGTEGEKLKVASGEYNKAIEAKIEEIKRTCGL
jgi:hypothetical protein